MGVVGLMLLPFTLLFAQGGGWRFKTLIFFGFSSLFFFWARNASSTLISDSLAYRAGQLLVVNFGHTPNTLAYRIPLRFLSFYIRSSGGRLTKNPQNQWPKNVVETSLTLPSSIKSYSFVWLFLGSTAYSTLGHLGFSPFPSFLLLNIKWRITNLFICITHPVDWTGLPFGISEIRKRNFELQFLCFE